MDEDQDDIQFDREESQNFPHPLQQSEAKVLFSGQDIPEKEWKKQV